MPAHFLATDNSATYRAYRSWRQLTAGPLVTIMVALIIGTGVFGAILTLGWLGVSGLWDGVEILAASFTMGFLLLFTFGVTYFPYLKRTQQVGALLGAAPSQDVNALDVASFSLIESLAPFITSEEQTRLPDAVAAIFGTKPVHAWLKRLDLTAAETLAAVNQQVLTGFAWMEWVEAMLTCAHGLGAATLELEHAAAALLLHPNMRSFLRAHDLQEQDIGFAVWWVTARRQTLITERRWWDRDKLLSFTGVGLSWSAGFTPLIDQFNHMPRGNLWDMVVTGREKYVDDLVNTLARERQSNVLLVGQAGTGRLGVIKELARRILHNQAHPALNGRKVVYLHIGELLARGNSQASQLAAISQALIEMERAGNIIAIIDGLGSVLGGEETSKIDLSEVLLPFFSSLAVKVVVVLSSEEYHLHLRSNEELIHFFEVVQIPSATEEETLQTLALAAPLSERESGVYLPYKTIRTLVESTSGILQQVPFPERAFDVLEEALVAAQAQRQKELTVEAVQTLITRKVGVPVGKIGDTERNTLLNLEETMHKRLIDQTQAVSAVARAMIRARSGVRGRHKPIGTFLFLGPTGVGKTETAKTLSAVYFGSEDYMSRLDMSQYQGDNGVSALVGDSKEPTGRLTSLIQDKPFTVLLLDEFEKAHPSVHQLFLPVFDEGYLTDARGRTVSFQHCIIIATSNAGAEFIRESVTEGPLPPDFDNRLRDYILRQNIFKPELVNRFDGIITFTPLAPEHIRQIAELQLKKLNSRLDADNGVTVNVTAELIEFLVAEGFSPEFGARPMQRLIQDTVEYAVAHRVLKGNLQPGQTITLPIAALKELQGKRGQ